MVLKYVDVFHITGGYDVMVKDSLVGALRSWLECIDDHMWEE